MKKLSICQWDEADRPREKLAEKGADALSNAELLAILIGSGTQEESAVDLMRRILEGCGNNLNTLGKKGIQELCEYKGIGPAKAITIMAACEFGKRRAAEPTEERPKIRSSKDIYEYFLSKMKDLPYEEVHALFLNNQLSIIGSRLIGRGGLTAATADIRIVLREAILAHATHIILSHNHPSGSIRPSREDDRLTDNLKRGAEAIQVKLLDHVIVTDGNYYSYADEGKI